MFNYAGSKYYLAGRYPAPLHDTIVEPFAGSAQYACRYWQKKVVLIEKDERIWAIWKYLQRSSPEEIRSLPVFPPKSEIVHPVPEARDLIALGQNLGTCVPQKRSGSWEETPDIWGKKRDKIASRVDRIRHWDIRLGSFEESPFIEATWFIDPPYQHLMGTSMGYREKKIDYPALAVWCRSRSGQVIVCEKFGADWLPFREFHKSKTLTGKTTEGIWTND